MTKKIRLWPKMWHPEVALLLAAALATRLWDLFQPNSVVFDEVYFKVFAAHYFDGRYYFDIHPPLGKLLLAAWAHVIGLNANAMLNGTAVGMRVLPAVAGALLVPVMWGILRRLGASRPFAFLGASLVLFDNALLVESRFILMDSMLLLFGLSAVYFYLVARANEKAWHWIFFILSAICAGLAVSTKWTGLNALAIVGLIWLWDQRGRLVAPLTRVLEAGALILIPLTIYVTVFWVHFSLLPKSGDGDAFMSTQFQATLVGNRYYNPNIHVSFWDKFAQLNREMYVASETLTATHPYGSKWYSWPLEIRPIYYWEGSTLSNGTQGNIYLLGNPIIWWGIWVSVVTGLIFVYVKRIKLRGPTVIALSIAGVAYLINYLPFVGITRVMFLYHYLFAFLYSIVFAIMLWNDLATSRNGKQFDQPSRRYIYVLVFGLIVLGFFYFSPLSYGTPLSPAGLQARVWLHSWR